MQAAGLQHLLDLLGEGHQPHPAPLDINQPLLEVGEIEIELLQASACVSDREHSQQVERVVEGI